VDCVVVEQDEDGSGAFSLRGKSWQKPHHGRWKKNTWKLLSHHALTCLPGGERYASSCAHCYDRRR
jgi:hypothetical protein